MRSPTRPSEAKRALNRPYMLDSKARKYLQPLLDAIAQSCHRLGISANTLTTAGMVTGLVAAALTAGGHFVAGFAILWLSGLIDAADGTLARLTKPSAFGAILDVTFDRIVEVAMITALALQFPAARFELVILAGTIAIAMSLFLSIGAAVSNRSLKSFHYAPGLGERTEGFICLSLMMLDHERLIVWTWVFIGMIIFTMLQRLNHVRTMLADDSK